MQPCPPEKNGFRTYCPIHRRYILWDDVCARIIDTPEFQRLRRIRQLGACAYVFPAATHTRFEHSLGVGYLAGHMIDCLRASQAELELDARTRRRIQIAGLCHDLGHGPFSHVFDVFLEEAHAKGRLPSSLARWRRHEARSVWVLTHLVAVHAVPLDEADLRVIVELIDPQTRDLPTFWYQIISNIVDGVDVDKLDYIQRDSAMLGMHHGVDAERFCVHARVVDGRLCYPTKMVHDVHALFAKRGVLHATVYQHATVKCVERMVVDYLSVVADDLLEHFDDDLDVNVHPLTWLTDDVFSRIYLRAAADRLSPTALQAATALLGRVERRDLYRVALNVGVPPDTAAAASAQEPVVAGMTARLQGWTLGGGKAREGEEGGLFALSIRPAIAGAAADVQYYERRPAAAGTGVGVVYTTSTRASPPQTTRLLVLSKDRRLTPDEEATLYATVCDASPA